MDKQLHNGYNYKDRQGQEWLMSPPYLKKYNDKQQVAHLFLSLILLFNGIKATNSELKLLAYMMVRGGEVGGIGKKLYIEMAKTSEGRVDNLICQLRKKKVIVKVDGKVRIHPKITIGFKDHDNFIFQFKCQKSK